MKQIPAVALYEVRFWKDNRVLAQRNVWAPTRVLAQLNARYEIADYWRWLLASDRVTVTRHPKRRLTLHNR